MNNAERERAIQLLRYYGEKLRCKAEFNLAIKALEQSEIKGRKETMNERDYTEFDKLVKMLDEAEIPYERDDDDPNHDYYKRTGIKPIRRIIYGGCPEKRVLCICSIICGHGTYGGDEGLLEIMGLLTPEEEEKDDVAGWLTAEDVFNRIKDHYDSNKEERK